MGWHRDRRRPGRRRDAEEYSSEDSSDSSSSSSKSEMSEEDKEHYDEHMEKISSDRVPWEMVEYDEDMEREQTQQEDRGRT